MKNFFLCLFLIGLLSAGFSTISMASTIILAGDTNIGSYAGYDNDQFYTNVFSGMDVFTNINDFSVTNWNATTVSVASSYSYQSTFDATDLIGFEWFIASGTHSYSALEISVIDSFLDSGGSMFVVGEGDLLYHSVNVNANELVSGVGGTMQINYEVAVAAGVYWDATGSEIGSSAFTSGVNSFRGIYASAILGGSNLFSEGSNSIIAYEEIKPIPEPATMILFVIGLLGLAGVSRKKQ